MQGRMLVMALSNRAINKWTATDMFQQKQQTNVMEWVHCGPV